MAVEKLTLIVMEGLFGVCRLTATDEMPAWGFLGEFFSVTRTADEISIVCAEQNIPDGILCEKNWRMIKIQGILDFNLVGIVAGVSTVLAGANVALYVLSTYNTDYILVKQHALDKAVEALKSVGYNILVMESVWGSGDNVQFQE